MNDFVLLLFRDIAINCHNVEYEHNSFYGDTMQSLYNTNCYNTNLDIALSCYCFQIFYCRILQSNYRKMRSIFYIVPL